MGALIQLSGSDLRGSDLLEICSEFCGLSHYDFYSNTDFLISNELILIRFIKSLWKHLQDGFSVTFVDQLLPGLTQVGWIRVGHGELTGKLTGNPNT